MAGHSDDVIDLSDSFIRFQPPLHLRDTYIVLDSDDSVILDTEDAIDVTNSLTPCTGRRSTSISISNTKTYIKEKQKPKKKANKPKEILPLNQNMKQVHRFGDCPICFDPLGQNPLASTKCGHVYCMKCLMQYLSANKKCPTCRQNLTGKSSYHPLYLNS